MIGTVCKSHSKNDRNCKKDYKNDIGYGQQMQELNQQCTNVTYTVNSQSDVSIEVRIDYEETPNVLFDRETPNGVALFSYEKDDVEDAVIIKVALTQCPVGFEIENSNSRGQLSICKCSDYYTNQGIICDISTGTITKPSKKWLFSGKGIIAKNILPKLINRTVVHNSCPYDYCVSSEKSIDLGDPDQQCNLNRSGVLCGACKTNLSIVLGTSNCKECSNVYLLLIIPFALAGVALVVLLLKCNLTVSVGHINGIIFYANIVQVNKALLFPNQGTAYLILSSFIAWLNLDLGIETCFFEHMDSYTKVWLQFVFPVYLWIIIGFIIVLANYSHRIRGLIGNNAVPVLATLFLLSYAKLLRTIISALAFTFIVFEDQSHITVWRMDGNIEYFNPKHTALFLVALLFTFSYIFPLTLLVLLAPCLQSRSHHKAFKWVNRLKPFFDAYQGPYSDKFRFWTGLLLISRVVLFIVYASNYESDPSLSFFCTTAIAVILAMILVKTAVYRHNLANSIELLSLLNIVTLCAVSWLTTTTGYEKWPYPIRECTIYISVSVMIVVFLGIVLYQLVIMTCPKAFDKRRKLVEQTTTVDTDQFSVSAEPPTSTTVSVELKEPLLDTS